MIDNIRWLGHGSFMIQGPPFIFIDPWRVVRSAFHADIILISHEHYDHCSTADIEKLRGPNTQIIGNEAVSKKIENTTIIRPWQSMSFDRISIKAIPAYAPDGINHKKSEGGLGFVISLNYFDIYYAGDTKLIPEMERISPDIVILPIDNHDTCSIDEAVKVVELLSPRWVIPSNWGGIGEGASAIDANEFKARIGGRAQVIIPTLKKDS
jgi:L-ascorbate metabolism protein UlaG (beta-lactamase superfamily)